MKWSKDPDQHEFLYAIFKEVCLGKTVKVGAASSGGPDAQMLELKHELRKSGKLPKTKLQVWYRTHKGPAGSQEEEMPTGGEPTARMEGGEA